MTALNVDNRTIFCHDNLDVLQGINSGCIDLIYLDPPFNKNRKFTAPVGSSAEGAHFDDIFKEEDVKDEWLQTIKEDQPELYSYLTGIKGVGKSYNFAYLAYMAIRLLECHRVLKPTGSIYLHCERYVAEFAGRHNDREADTIDMMAHMAQGIVGRRLRYRDLIAG